MTPSGAQTSYAVVTKTERRGACPIPTASEVKDVYEGFAAVRRAQIGSPVGVNRVQVETTSNSGHVENAEQLHGPLSPRLPQFSPPLPQIFNDEFPPSQLPEKFLEPSIDANPHH